MDTSWLHRETACVLFLALTINVAYALQVEFFGAQNYTDFSEGIQKKTGEDGECYNLEKSIQIGSIKTDKCLILYDTDDCTRATRHSLCVPPAPCVYYSYRVETSTPQFDTNKALAWWNNFRRVKSFHVCSQERGGGPSLDLDYYDKAYFEIIGGKLTGEWRDVCTCQNVPQDIRGNNRNYASIDNHGNDVEVFSEQDCRGDGLRVPAGDNVVTRSITMYTSRPLVASFRPAGNLDCVKLEARIFRFYFKNGTLGDGVLEEKVKLAGIGEIVNDGPLEIIEDYKIIGKLIETVKFRVADGYRSMYIAGTEGSVETLYDAGVPLVEKTDVSTEIAAKYEYTREDPSTITMNKTVSKEVSVHTSQMITIPGCRSCTINAYVKQVKDFPIDYDSYSKVSGYGGKNRLKVKEIKDYLPAGVDYVGGLDGFTVEAVTQGTMYATFGVKTLIAVKCTPIPNCESSSDNSEPSTVYYEIPFESVDEGHLKSGYQYTNQIGTAMGHYWNTLSEKV